MPATLKPIGHSHTTSLDECTLLHPVRGVDQWWPKVKIQVERVLNKFNDTTPIDNIYQDLKSSNRQLWVITDVNNNFKGCILTQIQDYYKQRIGTITHVAGQDFEKWVTAVEPLRGYFKAEGCDVMRAVGRRGWRDYLSEVDLKPKYIVYERNLNG